MKRSIVLNVALLGGITFTAAGCATHGLHPISADSADSAGSGHPAGAGAQAAVAGPAVAGPETPRLSTDDTTAIDSAPSGGRDVIAVGHATPWGHADATGSRSTEVDGTATVAYQVGDLGRTVDLERTGDPERTGDCPQTGLAGACPSGNCPPTTPHGYATQPTTFNRFGIDPQEFLCDGGDHPPPTRLNRNDNIIGLQPEDTVVHGTNTSGEIEFRASNRVCLYAPRFASVRKITGAVAGQGVVGAIGVDRPVGPNRIDILQPRVTVTDQLAPARSEATRRLDAMRERNRGIPVEGVRQLEQATDVLAAVAGIRTLEIDRLRRDEIAVLKQAATNAVTWSTNVTLEVAVDGVKPPVLIQNRSVEGVTVYDFPDSGRLQIAKLADRHHAQPGDTVTFMIRVDNVGDSPIDHVVVTDNLTTRLAYVDGTQQCSVGAAFIAEPNPEGSARLEWKLDDELAVGDSATIRFECLVR